MKLIYDCDNTTGLPQKDVDDGVALFYLLQQPEVTLLGVTLTFGNGTLAQVMAQTALLWQQFGLALSMYPGHEKGQVSTTPSAAATFMATQVRLYPHEVTILATGSLANLAEAAEIEPDFFELVHDVVVMGGRFDRLLVNHHEVAELNFSVAPAATRAVFESQVPLTVVSGQYLTTAVMDRSFLKQHLAPAHSENQRWLQSALFAWMDTMQAVGGVDGFINWDGLTALALCQPAAFTFTTQYLDAARCDWTTGLIGVTEATTKRMIRVMIELKDLAALNGELITALNKA